MKGAGCVGLGLHPFLSCGQETCRLRAAPARLQCPRTTEKRPHMKAVGYKKPLPINDPESLLDIEIPTPQASRRDLLVEVKAVSVNPVDVKVRRSAGPDQDGYKVLGWDAAGMGRQAGPEGSLVTAAEEVSSAGP